MNLYLSRSTEAVSYTHLDVYKRQSDERTNELKEELKNITKELKEKGNVLTQRRENAAKVLEERCV